MSGVHDFLKNKAILEVAFLLFNPVVLRQMDNME